MESILSFFGTLCVASVVLTALWFLVPKGATENIFKYAMGIFLISVIVTTFKVALKNPFDDLPTVNTDSAMIKAQSISASTTEYVLKDLLERCNIKIEEVAVIVDNQQHSGINISKARIEFVNDDDFFIAKEIIKKQTGIDLVR